MISPDTLQTESPVAPEQATEPEPPFTLIDDASETLDITSPPPPPETAPSLTASQKTRRKLSKIVIQPILPLEPTTPLRKKLKTGKTALTLEPLRPTTSLPPVSGFVPKERKAGKSLIRTGQLSFGDFSEKTVVTPPATPPPDPIAPAAPSNWSSPPPLPPLLPLPTEPESAADLPAIQPWFLRIPREIIYAGAALGLIIVCVIFSFIYLIFTSHEAAPSTGLANPENAPPPPIQIDVPRPPASPQTAADYSARGFARQAKGDLDGAIQDYDQALSLDPKNVEALYRHGLARQAKGDFAGALADYTQVVGLDPKQADAYSNRAFIKQGQGDPDGALADYAQALSLNPKIPVAYYNEALIKVQKGDLDGAIADYDHALELDPKMAIAYYNRGVAKNTEGNLDGAIADYTQAVALNPAIARAFCARGFARQTKGDLDGALADYSQALSLNPKLADAFYNRGLIKVERGDLDGAIADNTEAINLDPKNGLAYSNRGLAHFGKGSLDDAAADLKKFCEVAPRDGSADFARLYIWLIATEQNPKGDADQELSTSLLNEWNSPPEDLTSKIAAFLLGHINESDLIANAASPDPSREPGQYCKVWYFAGIKRLLAGDMTTAITYFQKSIATNQKDAYEYIFSQAELKALGQGREVASKPASGP